jgi:hypothetical protein
MKMVEFTRDMRPHRTGETRIVPDAMADKLIAEGRAKLRESVFDKTPLQPAKPTVGKAYKTRKRK